LKILHVGYYWLTLHQDARRYTATCNEFQRIDKPTQKDEIIQQPQVNLGTFEKWGMDLIRPIDPSSRQKRYIIVCIDYLTRCAKVRVVNVAMEKKVVTFLRENIF